LIVDRRLTTINHAFASAIAIIDEYDPNANARAVEKLGQNPNEDLSCVYCGKEAQTWDHVFALVDHGEYSGFGHTLGNLVPCCKECNSQKGNRNWKGFLRSKQQDEKSFSDRAQKLTTYITSEMPPRMAIEDIRKICPAEMEELVRAKSEVILQMEKADTAASQIRKKVKDHLRVRTQGSA